METSAKLPINLVVHLHNAWMFVNFSRGVAV
jgi:hypothetical protein